MHLPPFKRLQLQNYRDSRFLRQFFSKEDKILNKMSVFLYSSTQTVDQERQMKRKRWKSVFGENFQ